MKTPVRGFIEEATNSKTPRADGLATLKWQLSTVARLEAVRRSLATAGGGALLLVTDFNIIMKLSLTQFYKILSNFL
jgi:hypothetical protein